MSSASNGQSQRGSEFKDYQDPLEIIRQQLLDRIETRLSVMFALHLLII